LPTCKNLLQIQEKKMSIETFGNGGVIMTGNGIEVYRLALLLQGLKMQARGMRMSNKIPQATTIARKQYGMKGNLEKITAQVEKLLAETKAKTAYVEDLTR
jgi:hypothetical protein